MKKSRSAVIVITTLIIMTLMYGYWRVSTHGWLNVHLYDQSNKENYGRIIDTKIIFSDEAGALLAEGKSDNKYGGVHVSHPQAGYCTLEAIQRPYSKDNRELWKSCHGKQTTWLMKWAKQVRFIDLGFNECQFEQIPAEFSESLGDWWLWWVPLPHMGGDPYTSFSMSIRVDSTACTIEIR